MQAAGPAASKRRLRQRARFLVQGIDAAPAAEQTETGFDAGRDAPRVQADRQSAVIVDVDGRDCKGSRMRATVKLAVICVSLLISAHADAVGRRNQINALDFQERGARLRLELERAYKDLRRTGGFKSAGNDVSSIVRKYVPVGTSFAEAAITLRSSGFDIDPLPPREPKNPSPHWSDEHKSMMRFAIFGTLVLAQHGVSKITVEITLLPKILEADHNTVKGVHAAIYYR